MSRGAKPGERRGGRSVGTKNRATIEKERQAELERRRTEAIEAAKAEGAEAKILQARNGGVKLAKDVLREIMELSMGQALMCRPWPPQDGINPQADPAEFKYNLAMAADVAKALAPFESPKFSAVMVGGAIVQKIEIVGGLPDEEDGGLMIEGQAVTEPGCGAEVIQIPKAVGE